MKQLSCIGGPPVEVVDVAQNLPLVYTGALRSGVVCDIMLCPFNNVQSESCMTLQVCGNVHVILNGHPLYIVYFVKVVLCVCVYFPNLHVFIGHLGIVHAANCISNPRNHMLLLLHTNDCMYT